MYITGIRYRKQGAKTVRGWRLSAGVGKLRPVVAFSGDTKELDTAAHSIIYALSGKKHSELAEVWLDAADDAGDVWTIERGVKGSLFRKNNRMLSTEEAQGSILASLLDLDASLSQAEVLVAPVELRQIIARGADVAATVWDLNARDGRREVAGLLAARELASRCADISGRPELVDEKKLSRIAGPSARILGAVEELKRQAEQLGDVQNAEQKADKGLEAIQSEVDVLNQIDQLLRRINEGGESFSKLSSLLEAYDNRLAEIESQWTKETLSAIGQMSDPCQLLDQLVRLRAWGRFTENLGRVKAIIEDQVRPIQIEGARVWSEYLAGARSNGQEVESCLASMLLGIKQMAQEVDRYVSQAPVSGRSQARSSNWFEKLKAGPTKVVDDRFKEAAPTLQHQRDWITKLARDVDAVKVATEFALQASQGLSDKVADARERLQKEMSTLGTMTQKSASEHDRLKSEWSKMASETVISDAVGIEQLATLIRDAHEYLIIKDTRQDLAVRIEDRKAVQVALETQVRQWWDIIGSQKSTDLGNVSFLIAEAKGALRYREGRRQRIQKGLEDTARLFGTRSTATWVAARREELSREWAKLFNSAELPVVELEGPHTRELVELAHRCAALLDIARIEEQERFAAASLWPSRLDSAVLVYRWADERVAPTQKSSFAKALTSFTGDGSVPVVLLISDADLCQMLVKSGTGSASPIELDGVAAIEGPRREGAIVKAELKGRRPNIPASTKTAVSDAELPQTVKPSISSRAEAALRVLNPKSSR